MRWLQRAVVAPLKRALQFAVALISTEHDYRGAVAGKMREEVRTCGYPDIQVMWDLILQRSATAVAMKAAAASSPLREKKRLITMKKIKKKAQKRSATSVSPPTYQELLG